MNPVKNGLVWGSIFRHALALCLAVPFAGLADGSFQWGGVTGTPGEADFSMSISQDVEISALNTAVSIAKFDSTTFNNNFWGDMQRDSGNVLLPFYARTGHTWELASVLIEIEIESASVSGTFTVTVANNQKNGSIVGSPVLTIGNFTLVGNDNQPFGNGSSSVIFSGTITEPVTGNNSTTHTVGFPGDVVMTLSGSEWDMSADKASFTGTDSVGLGVYGSQTVEGLQVSKNGNHNPVSQSVTSLSGLNLNLKITYVITPEPGTMALLLTGVPLLLVRRRKSLKKV